MKGGKPIEKLSKEERNKRRNEAVQKQNKIKEGREAKERAEIKELVQRITIEMPAPGKQWVPPHVSLLEEVTGKTSEVDGPKLTSKLFSHLPISQRTINGLKAGNFMKMSEIQAGTIPHALAGRDVLGEAQTGSGKTLAFVIPALEVLFRDNFASQDGLGVLIVTPTRELAAQIFDVVRVVGRFHDLSCGVVIGGKDVEAERERINSLNILVATPGRLQQHIDETPGWDAANCKMLILDEADRMLDAGFKATMDVIFAALPKNRQTLLFSATLHSAVTRLADLNLRKSVERISVDAQAQHATPAKLQQVNFFVPPEQKLDTLYSFLRAHSRKRMLVFVSTCKQVRFVYEAYKQLKPGCMVLELHGKQKQQRRMETIDQFTRRTEAVVMICTDVAARGLDFPTVDWVIQYDCPDSVESYLHRVGRTARFGKSGSALMMLSPSEEPFLRKLQAKNVPIVKATPNAAKQITLKRKLASMLAEQPELRHLAQKAFISYLRALALMPDKEVFNAHAVNGQALAEAYGLPSPPAVTLPGQENTLTSGAPSLLSSRQVFADSDDEEATPKVEVSFENNPAKLKKNQSKLEKLKDKIRQKKESKRLAFEAALAAGGTFDEAAAAADAVDEKERSKRVAGDEKLQGGAADSDVESMLSSDAEMSKTKLSKKERKLQRAKDAKERLKEEALRASDELAAIRAAGQDVFEASTEGLLKPIDESRAAHTMQLAEERSQEFLERARAIAKEGRLRFRADGTAKIRGLGGASIAGAHNFFGSDNEDEGGETKQISRFQRLVEDGALKNKQAEEDSSSSSDEDGGDASTQRQRFLDKMRSKLQSREEMDKTAEKERVQAVHKRRKEKLKMATSRDTGYQVELGGDSNSDSDDGSFASCASSDEDSNRPTKRGGRKQESSDEDSSSSSSEEETRRPVKRSRATPVRKEVGNDIGDLESAALAMLGGF